MSPGSGMAGQLHRPPRVPGPPPARDQAYREERKVMAGREGLGGLNVTGLEFTVDAGNTVR